jgi:hypothetical protein
MNLCLANDNMTAEQLNNLAPHKGSLNLNKVRSLSRASSMPKPVASTIANWLYFDRPAVSDPAKLAFMDSICEPA